MIKTLRSFSWRQIGITTIIIFAIFIIFRKRQEPNAEKKIYPPDVTEPLPPSNSILGIFPHAAVVTNGAPCADIARGILLEGGKAVDAMIAAMLCDGVTMPQNMGIGGGFFMLIYDKKHKRSYVVNARETAPLNSSANMFKEYPKLSQNGGLSIAVPGELKGYWTVYKKFGGGVPWRTLLYPTIKLCETGIPINKNLERTLIRYETTVINNFYLKKLFTHKDNGKLLKENDTYVNVQLAKTLRIIAEEGGDALYTGSLANSLVKDIQENGGIITLDDLINYKVRIEQPICSPLFGNTLNLHTVGPPASGIILSYILRILDGLLPTSNDLLDTHRITEAFKFGYGARSNLGDPHFTNIDAIMGKLTSETFLDRIRNCINDTETWNDVSHYGGHYLPEDHGTAALSLIAENGDAVSVTSTINLIFGSKVVSSSTGILLNNQMDDFSSLFGANYFGVEPSLTNFITPRKRPLSSMCPSIVTDSNGDVKMTIGAAGGIYITSSVVLTILRTLVFNMTIKESIDAPMFHHQLLPMVWSYWYGVLKPIVDGMQRLGHNVSRVSAADYACVNAIHRNQHVLNANTDHRRPGSIAGY